jgi:polyhydroxyalkanoate synthesis repressor PhaR
MTQMPETPTSAPKTRRIIKRYSNRKLYDTRESRYVTLQQIGQMVRQGDDVQVIDNATKEDKTEVTLALVISEDLKQQPRSVPLGSLRDMIQERGERLLSQLREGPIGRLIPGAGTGEEEPGALAPEAPSEPPPQEENRRDTPIGRLTELVETSRHTLDQWQQAVDERVRAIVPGLGQVRELVAEVQRLSERVSELESELRALRDRAPGESSAKE